jgi:endonuclease/exonuclease/phosphatase (EEP) superfamily protein YafD
MASALYRRLNLSRQSKWFQAVVPGGSIALCVAITLVFWLQPDAFAAVLVLPRWLWIAPGLALALLGLTRQRKRITGLALILWLIYCVFFIQEFRRLFRLGTTPAMASGDGKSIRVVSLNCNGGNEKAAAEVTDYHPDLVLFEESPLRPVVRDMATKLLGPEAERLTGSDVSIIARGKVTPLSVENAESAPFAHARVQFVSGLVAEVFVVRLQPYNIRADLWSPDCWRKQCAIRKQQRAQFEWIEREVQKIPPDVPIILGGDFNLPAGDKLFRILNPRLGDTFRKAGRGWGDTLDNDLPVLRIDQIWCDEHFRPVLTEAHRTVNSDHRMAICDLLIVGK